MIVFLYIHEKIARCIIPISNVMIVFPNLFRLFGENTKHEGNYARQAEPVAINLFSEVSRSFSWTFQGDLSVSGKRKKIK